MSNINQKPRDKNGNKHGEWIKYHYNDQLEYRWNFIHGIEHGLQERYYENGKLSYRGYCNMGREIGYWCLYNKQKRYYLCII